MSILFPSIAISITSISLPVELFSHASFLPKSLQYANSVFRHKQTFAEQLNQSAVKVIIIWRQQRFPSKYFYVMKF